MKTTIVYNGELLDFLHSERYNRWNTIPLTDLRILSYINNPIGREDDAALFFREAGEELVGFISVFRSCVRGREINYEFGQLSANWVREDFRRQGIQKHFFKQILDEWDQKIGFTNYTPVSEQLYLSTGIFLPFYAFRGLRYYFFHPLKRFFSGRFRQNSLLLRGMNNLVNTGVNWSLPSKLSKKSIVKPISETSISDLANRLQVNEEELAWRINYPWITDQTTYERFPFTGYVNRFQYYVLSNHSSVLLLGLKGNTLKLLYATIAKEDIFDLVDNIFAFCSQLKVEELICLNPTLNEELNKRWWLKKPYTMNMYATNVVQAHTDKFSLQLGDTDLFFS